MAPINTKRQAEANKEEIEVKKPKFEIKEEVDETKMVDAMVVNGSGGGEDPWDEEKKKKVFGAEGGIFDDEAVQFDALEEVRRFLSKLNVSHRKLHHASGVPRSSIQTWLSGDTVMGSTNRGLMLQWFHSATLDDVKLLRSRHHAPRVVGAAVEGRIAQEAIEDIRHRCQQALNTTHPGPDHEVMSIKSTKKLAVRLNRRLGL